jgi:acetyltransferase-like isoleucine patch superfamily enzyme
MYNRIKKGLLLILSIKNTVIFNFKYLKFAEAIKFPFLISHRVYFKKLNGSVEIKGEIRRGLIQIGFGDVGIFDEKKSRTVWQVHGSVTFEGKAIIGHGTKISVGKFGNIIFGENFVVTAESELISNKRIEIGNNVLISWSTLIMDSDFHIIKNISGTIINRDEEIIIGDNVWIGCRCTILKGSYISENTVVSASSVITKKSPIVSNAIIGGNPTRILKENILWEK